MQGEVWEGDCHLNGVTLMGSTQTQQGGWEGSSEVNWPCKIYLMKGIWHLLQIMYILPNTESA